MTYRILINDLKIMRYILPGAIFVVSSIVVQQPSLSAKDLGNYSIKSGPH
jgi:hypothetical protein